MAFLYSIALKLLYPTSVSLLLLVVAPMFRRGSVARRVCYGLGVAVLVVCGNGWVSKSLVRNLERQYVPTEPPPAADAILVLSGGVLGRSAPRPIVEVADAGDRVLYGAELYRQRKAPQLICTGNVATGGIAPRPAAEDMAELLTMLGVPGSAIVTEVESENTHDHAVNLCPFLQERQMRSVLLVTSAMHMPRSIATFRRTCPAVAFIPAPTDFRVAQDAPVAWYRDAVNLLPTPGTLLAFSDAIHEYVGMAYYRARGWA